VTLLEIIRPFSGRNFKFTTRISSAAITVQPARRICSFLPPLVFNLADSTVHSVPPYSEGKGYRGQAGVNRQSLAELVERVSAMLLALPEIEELDLNPVIYSPVKDTFIAADARIRRA